MQTAKTAAVSQKSHHLSLQNEIKIYEYHQLMLCNIQVVGFFLNEVKIPLE